MLQDNKNDNNMTTTQTQELDATRFLKVLMANLLGNHLHYMHLT